MSAYSHRRLKLALGVAMTLVSATAARAQGSSFFYGFDTLDRSIWYISDGWSNGPHQNCGWSTKEVGIAEGKLLLGFTKGTAPDDRLYRCGELQSNQLYGYGTYEARMKTPSVNSGMNAAFFSYIGPSHGSVHDEIDFEVLLKDPSRVHLGGYVDGKEVPIAFPELPQAADDGYLDYAFVWESDKVSYYVNGQLLHRVERPAAIPSHPQKIFFSLWGSDTLTDWMGLFVEPTEPLHLEVDWVAYTAPGEICLFPESITC